MTRANWLVLCFAFNACKPTLIVGTWDASTGDSVSSTDAVSTSVESDSNESLDSTVAEQDAALVGSDWQTGFEHGGIDYEEVGGECFSSPAASFTLVASPVHSGGTAAAFAVTGNGTEDGFMAHCGHYGPLPQSGYYAAWFYVPPVISASVWALMHFDGENSDVQHELWDIGLELGPDGQLRPYVRDYLRTAVVQADTSAVVLPENWFHLEVFLKRAVDASGTLVLYLNGDEVLRMTDIVTEDVATTEWYVGNFVALTVPMPNTVYVDDVTLSLKQQGGT